MILPLFACLCATAPESARIMRRMNWTGLGIAPPSGERRGAGKINGGS